MKVLINRLNVITRVGLWRYFKWRFIENKRLFLFGKVSLSLNKRSSICINDRGSLSLNISWSSINLYPALLVMRENAKLTVTGAFRIYSGSKIYINEQATLELGSGYINESANISCFKSIKIGKNVAISENVCIRDSDNHELIDTVYKEKTLPVVIGNRVWIGMNVTILKGVTIGEGSVIAAGAVVVNSIPSNCLAAGIPAKVIKSNIQWK